MVLGNGDAHTVTVVKVIDAGNDAGMEEVQLALDEAIATAMPLAA